MKRYTTKQAKARTRRRLKAQERLQHQRAQAQLYIEALHQALIDLDFPDTLVAEGIPVKRDISYHQSLSVIADWRLRARGNSSIWDNTVSNRSGNSRRKNREAGVDPSEARQSKLCRALHTL